MKIIANFNSENCTHNSSPLEEAEVFVQEWMQAYPNDKLEIEESEDGMGEYEVIVLAV